MNELMTRVFENEEFGKVRTIVENGEVLFCGTDVARALKYARPLNAISQHCPHSLKRGVGVQTGVKADGTPAMQTVEMIFIPEGDVYRLVIHSRLETAVRFERWLFDEVLPTLRKTGVYAMLPQDYPSALRALADSVEERLSCTTIPHRSQPCDSLPSVETTVFFRSLKIEGCYGAHNENFICEENNMEYNNSRFAKYSSEERNVPWRRRRKSHGRSTYLLGILKTGHTPSAGNIKSKRCINTRIAPDTCSR